MVHNRLLGGRKGVWYYFFGLGFCYNDRLDTGMDSFSGGLRKAKSINWKKPFGIPKTLEELLTDRIFPLN